MTSVDNPPAQGRFRFSLHTLLLTLTLSGVLLGVWNIENTRWSEALRGVASTVIVCGVGEQILDLYRSWRSSRVQRERIRFAWEIAWRVVLCAALGAFAVETVYDRISHTENDFGFYFVRHSTIGWQLTLLILLSQLLAPPVRRETTVRENAYALILWGGILAVCFLVASGPPTVEFLVMGAIKGVQGAQASVWHGKPFYPFEPDYERWEAFKLAGYLAAVLLGAVFLAGWMAIKARRRWLRFTSSLVVIFLLGVLIAGNWWAQSELWALVPFRQPSEVFQSGYQSITLLAIAALFATAATVVLLREVPQLESWPTISAGLQPLGSYTHERRLSLALIAIAALEPGIEGWHQYFRVAFGPWAGLAGSIAYLLCDPPNLLALLCGWVLLRIFLRLRKPELRERDPLTLTPFHPWQACFVWALVVILLFTTLATFYWTTWAYLMWDYGGQT